MSKYYNDSQIQELMNKEIRIKLNLDDFNASSLLKKLRELLMRDD